MESKFRTILDAQASEHFPLMNNLIKSTVASGSIPQIRTLAQLLLSDQINAQLTRSCMTELCKEITGSVGTVFSIDGFEAVTNHLLDAIKTYVLPLDQADFILRDALFAFYIAQEEYSTAARILAAVNIDSTSRVFDDVEKADIYIKCAEAVLEDDEAIDAEVYMNKASAVINNCALPENYALHLRFRVTYARVLDANRKFVEAAQRYYELSTTRDANVVESDLLELFAKAITCAVLGKAGVQRTRVLALLYKDERLDTLATMLSEQFADHALVLTRVYKEQMLHSEELQAFESCLMPHQKATTKEGFSLLEKATVEHNMLAISKIYDNIGLKNLAEIVSLSPSHAEKVAATMIAEHRLNAIIDQAAGYLVFLGKEEDDERIDSEKPLNGVAMGSNQLANWDESIRLVCDEVTSFVNKAELKYAEELLMK